MAVAKGIRVEGLDELKQTLDDLAPREAFNLMRAVTHGVAQSVAKRARDRVPVDSGTLKKAIKAKRGNPRDNGGKPFSDVVVEHGKGAQHDAFYWRFIEYGTSTGIPEHRFIGNAIEAVRPEIDRIMREQFGKKFEALLARKAKKAAKAKG
jgi:phage protein, HK97 gp10 family